MLNLALDLDVSALLELGGELGQLAEDDEVMPFGKYLKFSLILHRSPQFLLALLP